MQTLRSLRSIVNVQTLLVTTSAVVSTYVCRKTGLTADFPLTLIGTIFPIVFSIGIIVVVFLPIMFMGDPRLKVIYQAVGGPLCVSVGASLLVALVFRLLDAFRVFDLIYVLTTGGPGTATEPLALLAFQTLFEELRFGYGAALSMLLFAVTSLLAFAYIRLVGSDLLREDR